MAPTSSSSIISSMLSEKPKVVSSDLTPPTNACGSWRTLYEGLADFLAELEAHIRLENDVLFPQFEA